MAAEPRNQRRRTVMIKAMARALACSMVIGGLAVPAWAASPTTIKLAYEVAVSHPKGVWAADFKAKAEELSGGQLKVDIYPNAQLFPSEQATFEAVTLGAIQVSMPASSHIASFIPQFDLFNIGYLFANAPLLYKFEDSPLGKEMLTTLLEPKGVKGLGWANNVPLMVFGTKKAYVKTEDFRGAKIRISGGPTREADLKALGASTVNIPAAELYLAAQQGVIDGALSSITFVATSRLYEVLHHVTKENLVVEPYPIVMNLRFWKGLPDDLKRVVEKSAEYAQQQNRLKLEAMVADAFKVVQQNKMQVHQLSAGDIRAWEEALKTVEVKVAPIIGPQWLNRVKAFVAQP